MVSLCGPRDVVRDRLAAFREAGVGTLMITPMALTAEDRIAPAAGDRRAAPSERTASASAARRCVRIFLGAFGEPGHAFPDARARGAPGRARARGHVRDVVAVARARRGGGDAVRAAPEYPVFPTRERPLKPYEAVVLRGRADPARRSREPQPDVVVHDILTLAPALAARARGRARRRRWSRTSTPRARRASRPTRWAPGMPRTAARARALAWARAAGGGGLRRGRAELNETRARLGLAPVQRLHGGISETLCLVGTFPQLEYPRRGRSGSTSSGR